MLQKHTQVTYQTVLQFVPGKKIACIVYTFIDSSLKLILIS